MAERTLIRGAHIISVDPDIGEIAGGDILIEGRHIAAVGRSLERGRRARSSTRPT